MVISRITSKAQTTVPRAMREALTLGPGDELEWSCVGDHMIVKKVKRKRKKGEDPLDKWVGYARDFFPAMTTDEIMEELRGPALRDHLR